MTQAINSEMGKNVGAEMARMLAPGGDLSKVVIANVEAAAGDLTNRLMVRDTHTHTYNVRFPAYVRLLCPVLICEPDTGEPPVCMLCKAD